MNLFNVYPIYDIAIVSAKGNYVYDELGNSYLDMYGGHAVISIGHTHPHYIESITKQIQKIGFYSNAVRLPLQEQLAEHLGKVSGLEDYQLFLSNSGAEANENALKLASFVTGRKKILAFSGSFHGRTSLAVAATDNPTIVAPVNETPNIIFLPFNDVEAVNTTFKTHGASIAAVITEGIQGVGGIHVASDEFLRAIRSNCDMYGSIFVADSVQCGYGRTGKFFAHDWSGIKADIYSTAKGMGNGFPVAGNLIAPHIKPKYGMLGTTFGGNHLACSAAIAVLEVIEKENLMDNAFRMGKYLMDSLKNVPEIKEIRGKGLMIGIEMYHPCEEYRKKLLFEHRIFTGSSSNKNTIRLLPPLSISVSEADYFIEKFKIVASNIIRS